MLVVRINDGGDSYVCKDGYLHDYDKIDISELEKDIDKRTFSNVDELKKAL